MWGWISIQKICRFIAFCLWVEPEFISFIYIWVDPYRCLRSFLTLLCENDSLFRNCLSMIHSCVHSFWKEPDSSCGSCNVCLRGRTFVEVIYIIDLQEWGLLLLKNWISEELTLNVVRWLWSHCLVYWGQCPHLFEVVLRLPIGDLIGNPRDVDNILIWIHVSRSVACPWSIRKVLIWLTGIPWLPSGCQIDIWLRSSARSI